MIDATVVDDLTKILGKLLPTGVADVKEDFEKNAKAAVQSALGRLDLVTREEFDVQAKVLHRTRMRLQELERRVMDLESGSEPASDTENSSENT